MVWSYFVTFLNIIFLHAWKQDRSSQGKDPSNYPEWFETTSDDKTCTTVPPTVNAGRPPSDICLNVSESE